MSRGSTVKTRIRQALEGAAAAGLSVARIEIDTDGKVVVIAGKPVETADGNANPWDEVLTDAAH